MPSSRSPLIRRASFPLPDPYYQKRRHRCLSDAPQALVRTFGVVPIHPFIQVCLELNQRGVRLLSERHQVELVQYRLVEPLTNPGITSLYTAP